MIHGCLGSCEVLGIVRKEPEIMTLGTCLSRLPDPVPGISLALSQCLSGELFT